MSGEAGEELDTPAKGGWGDDRISRDPSISFPPRYLGTRVPAAAVAARHVGDGGAPLARRASRAPVWQALRTRDNRRVGAGGRGGGRLALWRAEHDDGDGEDLEEHEVSEAVAL